MVRKSIIDHLSKNQTNSEWLLNCLIFADFSDIVSNTSSGKAASNLVAYDKNGLKITFTLEPYPSMPNTTAINVEARNNNPMPITEFLFQAAVPKVSLCFENIKLSRIRNF